MENAILGNRLIGKMVAEIEDLGCAIPKDFFVCAPAPDKNASGGFVMPTDSDSETYKPKIVMYENNIIEKESFEKTLAHELVHAYDQCRAKLEWKNCMHHACTEIRASNMSGECNWWHELLRGHVSMSEGKIECVKRRSKKSVSLNPYCKGISDWAVDTAFSKCYDDISPLNEDD
eukprot:CAMPEP_0185029548 /NCGR_PEP_ID=MMETSP1103-20130426/15916_1 /TAXON_ID=36769 /ORGANISM="Paraphysomonas bandaiensis, Strain Caron Lab Isolate" /LENGTH=174 /DNA_ID=CAMNT_0027564341 /DNA_START=136 /DNA_END=657 /DNA_ORIENTATION=-